MEIKMKEKENKDEFYTHAKMYWSKIPPTLDGILGGYGYTSHVDIKESDRFLKRIFKLKTRPGNSRALDCGAGIGRITLNLLIKHFDIVDMIEQNSAFIDEAKKKPGYDKVGSVYFMGLQNFADVEKKNQYDVIWCQWVLGHLTNKDLATFFKTCKSILKPNGIIVVKENIANGDENEFDETDCEITRTFGNFCMLFDEAGLMTVFVAKQQSFPRELYKVQMFALRPKVPI